MKNIEIAKKYQDYIVAMRRYFHENPELSGKEDNTVAKISQELSEMDIDHVIIPDGGILATIKGNIDNGRCVLLRADIDALPLQENDCNLKFKREVKSKVDGVMHACGHDGHTAMLLGAAKVLLEKKDEIQGTVYLCFERGEEGTDNMRYIFAYIEKNNIKIDTVFGLHLASTIDKGIFGINDTDMLAGAMFFDVTIEGRGGHGSRPDMSINPLDAFTTIYNDMKSIRLNKIDPYKTLTASIGSVNAGVAGNVIPQTVTFKGTMRTFDRDGAGLTFYNEFRKVIDHACAANDCTVTYNSYPLPGLATVNDPDCVAIARKAISTQVGEKNVVSTEPWMGSESFSSYLKLWPGVFAFLGMRNLEKGVGAAHHNHLFDVDEDVLYTGSAAAVSYALDFLKSDLDTESKKFKGTYKDVMISLGKEDEIAMIYGE